MGSFQPHAPAAASGGWAAPLRSAPPLQYNTALLLANCCRLRNGHIKSSDVHLRPVESISSSPAEHAVGFNAWSSVSVAVSSGSAASPWSPWHRIGPVVGPQHDVTEHLRALPHREVAAEIRTVQAATAPEAAKLAFEFLV